MIYDLVQDFGAVLEAMPDGHPRRRILALLDEAIRRDVHFIDRHPTTQFQCLWNNGWWYDCPEAAGHYAIPEGGWPSGVPPWERRGTKLFTLLEGWRAKKECATPGFPWVRSKRPPVTHLGVGIRAVLAGHRGMVTSVAYSPDGRQIAVAATDNLIRVYEAEAGAQIHCLQGHAHWVLCVAFSPDGRCLASGSADNSVRIWNAENGNELHCLRGHQGWIRCVAYSPDGRRVSSGSEDKTLRVWDTERATPLCCLRGHDDVVASVAFSPDGRRIISGSGSLLPLVVRRGKESDYSLEDMMLVAGSAFSKDQRVRLWDADTGAELACFRGCESGITSLAFSSDGLKIVGGCSDGTVRVWDMDTCTEMCCFSGHEHAVNCIGVAPDGRQIVSAGHDNTIRVWDMERQVQLSCLRGHEDSVVCVAYSPDGRWIVSGSEDTTVRVWDAASSDVLRPVHDHEAGLITAVAFSSNGHRVVSGGTDKTVRIWDATSGVELRRLSGHEGWITSVGYSPDNKQVASGAGGYPDENALSNMPQDMTLAFSWWAKQFRTDKTVRIWDAESGAEIACLDGHKEWVNTVAFSHDGLQAVSGASDRTVRLWDVRTGAAHLCLQSDKEVGCVAISPDSAYIACDGMNYGLHIWDVASGIKVRTLHGHQARIAGLAFSSTGRELVSVSDDKTIRFWDLPSGACVRLMETGGAIIDIAVYAFRSEVSPNCAFSHLLETTIKRTMSNEAVAWFPASFARLATHVSGQMWAAAVGNHLALFALEEQRAGH